MSNSLKLPFLIFVLFLVSFSCVLPVFAVGDDVQEEAASSSEEFSSETEGFTYGVTVLDPESVTSAVQDPAEPDDTHEILMAILGILVFFVVVVLCNIVYRFFRMFF